MPKPKEETKLGRISEKQHAFLRVVWRNSGGDDQQLENECIKDYGCKPNELTWKQFNEIIEGSGFNSVTEFIVYVLRDLLSSRSIKKEPSLSQEEIELVKKRLKISWILINFFSNQMI
jgi:hypothetical protein